MFAHARKIMHLPNTLPAFFVKKNDGKKRRIKFQSTCQNCLGASKWAQSDHPFWRSRAAYTCLERPGSSAHRSWVWGIFWLSFHIGATPNCQTSQRPCSLDMFVTKVFQMVTAKWHVQLNPHLWTATQICHNKLLSLLRMESLSHDHGTVQVHVLSKSHSVPIPKKIKPPCALCRFVAFWKFPNSPKTSLSCPPSAKITRFSCHATSLVYPSASNGRWKASTCPELGRIRSNELCLAS